MKNVQQFYKQFQRDMGWDQDIDKEDYRSSQLHLLYIHMLLTTEVAEVAEELRSMFQKTEKLTKQGYDEAEAFTIAKVEVKEDLGKELADCLAYLCNIANYLDYDLETELHNKLTEIKEKRRHLVRKS